VKIVRTIIKAINKEGGRLLKQDRWVVLDDKTAYDKVGHGFGNRKPQKRIPAKAAEKRTGTSSSSSGIEADSVTTALGSEEHAATKRFRIENDTG
jgi:hypothetical protein